MASATWTHHFTAMRRLPNGDRVNVEAGLVARQGNSRPYFSVTGDVTEKGRREPYAAGQVTAEILAVFPELGPVVALHLSDDRGVPMHAAANARYFAGFTGQDGLNFFTLAAHLRIEPVIAQLLVEHAESTDDPGQAIDNFVTAQTERWAIEAKHARRVLKMLIAREGS